MREAFFMICDGLWNTVIGTLWFTVILIGLPFAIGADLLKSGKRYKE